MVLDKKNILFERDEKGELIPQEVSLVVDEKDELQSKYKSEKIVIIPLSRGEIKKLFARVNSIKDDEESDVDSEIIVSKCKNPAFTKEDVKFMKPSYATMIVNTILFESGLQVGKTKKAALAEAEDDFAKN